MADLAEGAVVETVAGSAPAEVPAAGAAAHGTPGDDGTTTGSDAPPESPASGSEEDGQDAATDLSRSQRRAAARARAANGQFTADGEAEPEPDPAVADAPPASAAPPPATYTAEDLDREITRRWDAKQAEQAAQADLVAKAKAQAEAEAEALAEVGSLIGFSAGLVNPKITQYEELDQAIENRDWDTLDKYGVRYGDDDLANDIRKQWRKAQKGWERATTVADKRAWAVLDGQFKQIGAIPGVDAATVTAAGVGPQALIHGVTAAVESAVRAKDAEWQARHTAAQKQWADERADYEGRLEETTTRGAGRYRTPDAGGRSGSGGTPSMDEYNAMSFDQRQKLSSAERDAIMANHLARQNGRR